MFKPEQWGGSSCGNDCTHKFSSLMQIPWRVFCKKGCDADGDTWEECLEVCEEICYKDPVLKDQKWSAYIDRSPGSATYSEECFHACTSGCGFKTKNCNTRGCCRAVTATTSVGEFEIPSEKVDQVHPNRPTPPPPPTAPKPSPPLAADADSPSKSSTAAEDILCASA